MGVYRRPNTGTWEFRKTIRGVRYYESIPEAQNKQQAEVAGANILLRIYEGKYGKEGGELGSYDFVKFCDEAYLPHAREHLKRPEQVECKVKRLCLFFKGRQLREITLIEIEKFKRFRLNGTTNRKRPPCGATVKGDIDTLSTILNHAIDNDLLGTNPCRKVKWRKGQTESKRTRVVNDDELKKLMPKLTDLETRVAVIVSLNTGIRRMGILSLMDTDVDFDERKARYIAKGGKVGYAPLNPNAIAALKLLSDRKPIDGFLFRDRKGHTLTRRGYPFKLACERAGITDLNFHDLRRTFATRVKSYTDAFTVRDLLGHAAVETTADVYATPVFEEMRRAVEHLFHGTFTDEGLKERKTA